MAENYFGITDTGRQRTNNEDRFIAKAVSGNQFVIASVIDGVGGYVGGEVAAQLTAEVITTGLEKLKSGMPAQLLATLQKANELIIREKAMNPQNEKMACVVTLAVVDIKKNVFYFAHVGDTRLYLFRDGSLIKITRDHSTVGFLEESGRLSEESAMAHPKRNEVNKALGYEPNIHLTKDFIDTGESPFLPGDTILLCSDGLTDMVPSASIITILNNEHALPVKARHLVNAANEAGGADNITVVLVQNNNRPVKHEVTRPAAKKEDNGNVPTMATDMVHKEPDPAKPLSPRSTNRLLLPAAIIGVLLVLWLLMRQTKKPVEPVSTAAVPVSKKRSIRELALIDSLAAASTHTVRLTGASPFFISDTILVDNDSMHIIGNGITLRKDSMYAGPAFVLGPNCRYLLLDSLNLEDFATGILVLNKGLQLKHVQFTNCQVPLVFQAFVAPGRAVSGRQAADIFRYSDSAHTGE
jgi:serine/threonine protein phosphatase PrpC